MPTLTDTQSILLAHAANMAGGSVYPLPATLRPSGGVTKALAALLRRGLVAERDTSEPAAAYRADGDLRYGLFVTPAGLAAIGIAPEAAPDAAAQQPAEESVPTPSSARQTKAQAVLALLRRPDGATLAELIAATGWLPHTTRAALTGLRKKGHAVTRDTRDGAPCYRVAAA